MALPGQEDGSAAASPADVEMDPKTPPPAPATADLDDLFADVEADQPPPPGPQPAAATAGHEAPEVNSDPEALRSFYQRLFPWRHLFQWLNHSPTPSTDFAHREFAFTLHNDAYLRYQSFATADLLRKDVLRLVPSRFEIGPVYSANPRDRKTLSHSSAFKPMAKELCFDIDLTDYDDVRTCCAKASICRRCWTFMTMAMRVVDRALRHDFDFRHIIWIYSGRRGVHAWVCDLKARALSDQQRRAVAGYLDVVRGGAQSRKKVNIRRPLHPHLALDLLKPHFQHDILVQQDPWAADEQAEKLLQLLPDGALNESLRRKWHAAPGRTSTAKWADIDAVAKAGSGKRLDSKALLEAKQDIVLEYSYPRLDVEVSKRLNHLLKSPFVVHPGTGRVCVPIDFDALDSFDPLAVPTLGQLLAQVDAWKEESEEGGQEPGSRAVPDWEKTSLKPYVDYFRSFVAGLLKSERGSRWKDERNEDAMEF